MQMLAPGGCIAWHDYGNPRYPELTAYLDSQSLRYDLCAVGDTMLVFWFPEREAVCDGVRFTLYGSDPDWSWVGADGRPIGVHGRTMAEARRRLMFTACGAARQYQAESSNLVPTHS